MQSSSIQQVADSVQLFFFFFFFPHNNMLALIPAMILSPEELESATIKQ